MLNSTASISARSQYIHNTVDPNYMHIQQYATATKFI